MTQEAEFTLCFLVLFSEGLIMKQFFYLLLASTLLCTGCSRQTEPQNAESAAETTASALTSSAAATTKTASVTETMPVMTEMHAELPAEEPVLIAAPEISQPDYQGGDGGEEHAETPLPQYFTYRFYENGVSVRLAGGTYQSMEADLSAVSPLDAELGYYLYDSDFDGDLDLSVPVMYNNAQKYYAVFLWDSDDAHFAKTPVLLDNPQYFEDEKHVTTLKQLPSEAIVNDAVWTNGVLTPLLTVHADAEALTLTVNGSDADGELTENAADTEALIELVLQYYNRKAASQTAVS